MNVYVNSITGISDAITSMFMSKRTWTREKELEIRKICDTVLSSNGSIAQTNIGNYAEPYKKFDEWMNTLVKWGWKHTTMLRFIDISVTVEGLHRAGQDDWDSHAKRFNNRIIRSSTRLATYNQNEMSDYYKDKILPTDVALAQIGMTTPDTVVVDGKRYVRSVNGYILEEYKDNKDVRRGLYMLSIPSNFIFKIDLCEWGHVYKERNKNSNANPEVKECCESIADRLEEYHKQFNRELFEKIKN